MSNDSLPLHCEECEQLLDWDTCLLCDDNLTRCKQCAINYDEDAYHNVFDRGLEYWEH